MEVCQRSRRKVSALSRTIGLLSIVSSHTRTRNLLTAAQSDSREWRSSVCPILRGQSPIGDRGRGVWGGGGDERDRGPAEPGTAARVNLVDKGAILGYRDALDLVCVRPCSAYFS